MSECLMCARVRLTQAGQNPNLIHEFKNSYLMVGDHQYFKGYSVLVLKDHVRELHELTAGQQQELFKELMVAGKAVNDAFKPWKMNYSCYGNQVPHIHWHLFPRYESDPDHLNQPWKNSSEFDKFPITDSEKKQVIELIRSKVVES